ncbi:MAG TPA: LuxR C-terminal-related transcriptional regulator [bacterium]|nr:LuxR C-terminal-related transcriptional regulator [bacterium]
MQTTFQQERLVDESIRATFEAATLDDLGRSVLPLLEQSLETSASLLYRIDAEGRLVNIAGTQVLANYEYMGEHRGHDPMQKVMHGVNPWICHASRYPEFQEMKGSPVYEFSLCQGIDDYLFLRLSETAHDAPGMVGILLARPKGRDFGEGEEFLMAKTLSPLKSLTRRALRWEEFSRTRPYVETMLESAGPPKIALDFDGNLLWASEQAILAIGLDHGSRRSLPEILVQAARRFRRLYAKSLDPAPLMSNVQIRRRGQAFSIRADLRVIQTRTGTAFVVAELEVPGVSPRLKEAALNYRLSVAETEVLHWLARGLADREIGKKLFISHATVRSHVGQILAKMGVASRVQAALLANGLHPRFGELEEE